MLVLGSYSEEASSLGGLGEMSGTWHGGKGDKARKVDQAKFSSNWDAIFGKKEEKAEDSDLKFMTAEDYVKGTNKKDE